MQTSTWPDGPFTWAAFAAVGGTRKQLERAVASHEVRRVLHGVYASTTVPDSIEGRCAALQLVVRPFEVVCDRTAAWLYGIDALQLRELDALPPIECVVLPNYTRNRRAECSGGRRDLAPHDMQDLHGLLVTTALRTALDLACRPGGPTALAVVDQFMREYGITRAMLVAEVHRYRGRRGAVQLRLVIRIADPLAESPGESWTRWYIIERKLPSPVLQYWVCLGGDPVFRVDMAYPHARIAVEFDGRDFHDSPEQRAHDEERRAWLREHGWTVIVVRAEDLAADKRGNWLGQIERALAGRT